MTKEEFFLTSPLPFEVIEGVLKDKESILLYISGKRRERDFDEWKELEYGLQRGYIALIGVS